MIKWALIQSAKPLSCSAEVWVQTGVVSLHHSGWVYKELMWHPQLSKYPPPCQRCLREGSAQTEIAFQWVTWKGSLEQREDLWSLLCSDQAWWSPSVATCPPLPHRHRLRGARANTRLEMITSAPHATMEKLHLAVPSSVRAHALNANTFVGI